MGASVRVRAYCERACVRAVIGEGDGKVGRNEKESGGGSEEGGVNEGRKDCCWKMKVRKMGEKGKHEMKKLSRCAKRGVRREKWERFPEKSPEVGPKTRQDEKKVGFTGQKTSALPRKIARNRVRNGEKREKRRFRSEKGGVGERRKNGILPILQCYEVTKWVQMNFSRIFFR